MRKIINFLWMLLIGSAMFTGCEQSDDAATADQVSNEVLTRLVDLGFDVHDYVPIKFGGGYLVERDIFLTDNDLKYMQREARIPVVEQYSTNSLVRGTPRNISVYIPTSSFSSTYVAALDEALRRYNAQNLALTFSRV